MSEKHCEGCMDDLCYGIEAEAAPPPLDSHTHRSIDIERVDRLRLATAAEWIDPEDIDRIADKYDALPPTPDHLRAALQGETT